MLWQWRNDGGQRVEKGITFQAIEAMEALNHKYHDPEQNSMYRFTVDGISVGHMGDIGNPLSDAHIAFFKDVDVLLALTGDHPTITLDDLKTAIDAICPRLVVPMHFQTLSYKPRNIFWIELFLAYFDPAKIDFALSDEVILNKAALPEPHMSWCWITFITASPPSTTPRTNAQAVNLTCRGD